jgi:hypothetical protein
MKMHPLQISAFINEVRFVAVAQMLHQVTDISSPVSPNRTKSPTVGLTDMCNSAF